MRFIARRSDTKYSVHRITLNEKIRNLLTRFQVAAEIQTEVDQTKRSTVRRRELQESRAKGTTRGSDRKPGGRPHDDHRTAVQPLIL